MFRQRAPRSTAQRLAIAVVAALTLALGYYLGNRFGGGGFQVPRSPQALVVLAEPLDLTDLSLTNHYGHPFGVDQLAGRWSLLAFAHPSDAEAMRAALIGLVFVHNHLVDQPALQARFRGLVVAMDPVSDPQTLRELVDIDSPDFLGLSGEADVVARLAGDRAGGHEATGLLLLDPKGRPVGRFTPDTPPATIAGDLKALARATAAD